MHIVTSKTLSRVFWPILIICRFIGRNWPVFWVKFRYFVRFHKLPNLRNPNDLNEKILWQKLYSDTSRWTELADKYTVREYVENLGLGDILVKLYGVWNNADDVKFEDLPNGLIFKINNGAGTGTFKIVTDLKNENKNKLKKLFKNWLNQKYIGDLSSEPQYKDIPPKIIAEELLPLENNHKSVSDYKIWCINGHPRYIWVCDDRDSHGVGISVMTYDTKWNAHPEYSIFSSDYKRGEIIPRPENLEKMLEIASKLSSGFPIVRVDLYNIKGKIYFGEMTFTSLGGMMNYFTPEFLLFLGKEADISRLKSKN